MKIKINKEVEVCDFCQREGFLTTCVVCRKKYCIMCNGIGYNPYDQNICKCCIKREDVEKVIVDGRKKYERSYFAQKAALQKLPKKIRIIKE
jgi:hypothetical protein